MVPFAVALVMLSAAISKGRIRRAEIGLNPPRHRRDCLWILPFLGYSLAAEALLFGYYHGHIPVTAWTYAWPLVLLRITGILLLAPVVEEILLRGVLLNLLRRRHLPIYAAIGVQSLVFTLLHVGALSTSWVSSLSILQIFVDGFYFGVVRYRTGSLYPAVAMHMLGNSIAVAERLFAH